MPLPDIQDAAELIEQDQPAQAIPLLERLAEALPVYAAAHVFLAQAYEQEERWEEALAAWQRAYFLVPASRTADEGLRRAIAARARASLPTAPATPPPIAPTPETPTRTARQPTQPAPKAPKRTSEAEPAQPAPPPKQTPQPQTSEAKKPEPKTSEKQGKDRFGTSDLDQLIENLEAVRILPRPDIESLPTPSLDDEIEDMVSETLARIYASQKQYDEAARVYELLAAQQPERATGFLEKARQMRARASDA